MKKSELNLSMVLAELQGLRQEIRSAGKRLLPVAEAAIYLGLSPRTIRNDLSRKVFPVKPVKYRGKILFRKDDLDAFIDGMGEGAP